MTTPKMIIFDGAKKRNSHYIWFLNTGYWPDWQNKREIIHHLDGDLSNDDFSNLRLITRSEQGRLYRSGSNHPKHGVRLTKKAKQKISGPNHPNWHGDSASAVAKYSRHRAHPDLYPPLTDEERQEYNAYQKERRIANDS